MKIKEKYLELSILMITILLLIAVGKVIYDDQELEYKLEIENAGFLHVKARMPDGFEDVPLEGSSVFIKLGEDFQYKFKKLNKNGEFGISMPEGHGYEVIVHRRNDLWGRECCQTIRPNELTVVSITLHDLRVENESQEEDN